MPSSSVQLFRYDLTNGMARQFSMGMTGTQIDAIWHTGIVCYGVEFYFDGGVGISEAVPGTTRFGTPAVRDDLGSTQVPLADFRAYNQRLQQSQFGPNHYDLLRRNCNHYTAEASVFLTSHSIPADVVNMIPNLLATPLGQMMRPNLEMMSRNPNVNAPSPAPLMGSGGFGGGQQGPVGGGGGARAVVANPAVSYSQVSEAAVDDDALETLQAQIVVIECSEEEAPKKAALATLERIVSNLVAHPRDPKFRRLSRNGATYTTKLAVVDGAEDFLLGIGFVVEGSEVVLKVVNIPLLMTAVTLLSVALQGETDKMSIPAAAPKAVFSWHRITSLTTSALPQGALVAGCEGDQSLYTGRCRQNGILRGGKFGAHLGGMNVCQDGKEVRLSIPEENFSCEVLCVTDPKSVVWVPMTVIQQTGGGVGAIKGALVPIDEAATIFVGRGKEGGDYHPGVASPSNNSAAAVVSIPYGGMAKEVADCDLLCISCKLTKAMLDQVDANVDGAFLLKQWKARTAKAFHSIDSFLKADPIAKNPIPLQPRLQRRKSILEEKEGGEVHYPKMVLCHDHEGGYSKGDQCSISLGADDKLSEKTYTVRHWEEVETFIYFSHAMVSVPTEEWVRSGHKHGALVLGTFIIEPAQGNNFHLLLQSGRRNITELVNQMQRFQAANSFDGWLLNIEVPVPPSLVENLLIFVRLLTRASLEAKDGKKDQSQVLWYDAVTAQGQLQYQNGLTQKNLPFLEACDGIFTNYWWNPLMAHFSAYTAGGAESGKTKQVYMGIDVYGRRTFGGGGFNCHTALSEIQKANLSCALFAPAWTAARAKSRTEYLEGETKMWGAMKPYLRNHGEGPCIVQNSLPFSTNFCSGYGAQFHTPKESSSNSWCQISLQEPSPQLVGTGIEWTNEVGLYSDRALVIGSKGAEAFPLFSVDLTAPTTGGRRFQLEISLLKPPAVLEEEELNAILLTQKGTHLRFKRVAPPKRGFVTYLVELPAGECAVQLLLAARRSLNLGGLTLSEAGASSASSSETNHQQSVTQSPSSPTDGMTKSYSTGSNLGEAGTGATSTKPITVAVQVKSVGNQTLLQFTVDTEEWKEARVQQVAVMGRLLPPPRKVGATVAPLGAPVFCGVGYEPSWCTIVDGSSSEFGDCSGFTFYVTYEEFGPLSPMQVQSKK